MSMVDRSYPWESSVIHGKWESNTIITMETQANFREAENKAKGTRKTVKEEYY